MNCQNIHCNCTVATIYLCLDYIIITDVAQLGTRRDKQGSYFSDVLTEHGYDRTGEQSEWGLIFQP